MHALCKVDDGEQLESGGDHVLEGNGGTIITFMVIGSRDVAPHLISCHEVMGPTDFLSVTV